ncbi:MAG: Cof-like hydrolase [Rhodospirillales bacterium]|nr:Cof-like hydrolase [Rhodospirillales bacterium]
MTKVSLVLSDVDGTLVTTDKRLTDANLAAVRELAAAGIPFTISSSRPPFGLRGLVERLALQLPFGAFNGGALALPDMTMIEQHLIPTDAAQRALALLAARGIDAWLFAGNEWLLQNPTGAYVDHEERTLQAGPTVVPSYEPYVRTAAKIVGVSADHAALAACETAAREALSPAVTVNRSQPYYLDLTPPGIDKGTVVEALSRRLAIPPEEIVTLGDMENDVPMFRKSGFSIAMGNAPPEVQAAASAVTGTNDADGFAQAVERIILPRHRGEDQRPR